MVLTTRVHVDAIAMARRELPLIGKWTVPFYDARPGNFQHIFLRRVRQEIKRHGRPIGLAQFLENRPILRVNPLSERKALVQVTLGKTLVGKQEAACTHGLSYPTRITLTPPRVSISPVTPSRSQEGLPPLR